MSGNGKPNLEFLYAILFIGTFPALWLLAAILDRFLPDHMEQPGWSHEADP